MVRQHTPATRKRKLIWQNTGNGLEQASDSQWADH